LPLSRLKAVADVTVRLIYRCPFSRVLDVDARTIQPRIWYNILEPDDSEGKKNMKITKCSCPACTAPKPKTRAQQRKAAKAKAAERAAFAASEKKALPPLKAPPPIKVVRAGLPGLGK
jgi:hypothetical protein